MTWLVFALGAALAIAGAISVSSGLPYMQVEWGWTEVIAGATAVSGGVVTIALGAVLLSLSGLRRAVQASGLVSSATAAFSAPPPLRGTSEPSFSAPPEEELPGFPSVAAPLAPEPVRVVPEPVPVPEEPAPGIPAEDDGALKGVSAMAAALDAPARRKPLLEQFRTRFGRSRPSSAEPRQAGSSLVEPVLAFDGLTSAEGLAERGKGPEAQERGAGDYGFAEPVAHEGWAPRPVSDDAAFSERREIKAPDVAPAVRPVGAETAAATPSVVGRYEANGASYVLYADGTIEVETGTGLHRFNSMHDLKDFIDRQEQKPGGDERKG